LVPKTWTAIVGSAALGAFLFGWHAAAEDAKPADRISQADAKKLKNPIPNTKESLARGRIVFLSNCTDCHGADGKAEAAIVASATDLTSPNLYKSGTSEGEIFRSIRDGQGDQMPAFKYQISGDEDLWHLVNYVRSLWPEAMRPPVVVENKVESKK